MTFFTVLGDATWCSAGWAVILCKAGRSGSVTGDDSDIVIGSYVSFDHDPAPAQPTFTALAQCRPVRDTCEHDPHKFPLAAAERNGVRRLVTRLCIWCDRS